MDFKAVIFDLDGTLLDTLEDLADAMNAVLQNNRLPVHDAAAYRYFVGDGIDMLVRRALPFEIADEEELNRFIREMQREYAGRWTQKTRPYPGILELLDAFSAGGFEMAVLSNKPDEATRHIIQAFLPGVSFRLVIGATSGKPKNRTRPWPWKSRTGSGLPRLASFMWATPPSTCARRLRRGCFRWAPCGDFVAPRR